MFDKKGFDAFRGEVAAALSKLAEKHQVTITPGKVNYSAHRFNLDLEVAKKEVNGKPFEQVEFENLAAVFGFEPSDYRRQFVSGGRTFTLVGFSPKSHSRPVLAEADGGTRYKFGVEVIRLLQ